MSFLSVIQLLSINKITSGGSAELMFAVHDYTGVEHSGHPSQKVANMLNKSVSSLSRGVGKQTAAKRGPRSLCMLRINGLRAGRVKIFLVSCLFPVYLTCLFTGETCVPNMVSAPYTEPLWLGSEEVGPDSESELRWGTWEV